MIEYRRRGRRRFVSEAFTIKRPSGWQAGRDRLALRSAGHDYNFRLEDDRLWLLDDEREVGYAVGSGAEWELVVGEHRLEIQQRSPGVNHSVVTKGEDVFAQVRAAGFPIRRVELLGADPLTDEQLAFVVAIALLGWREADRAMITSRGAQ